MEQQKVTLMEMFWHVRDGWVVDPPGVVGHIGASAKIGGGEACDHMHAMHVV
jgi:hypothetical protein